jgi:hypothetical protein
MAAAFSSACYRPTERICITKLDAGGVHLDYDDAPGSLPKTEPSALFF